MKKCLVSLSFDDGRLDNYINAFPIMQKYNLTGSFHIVTGFVDNTIMIEGINPTNMVLSKANLVEMLKAGNEISSHSNNHYVTIDEIKTSLIKLQSWNFGDLFGFSIPHSDENIYKLPEFKEIIENNELLYVRTGKNISKLTLLKKIWYIFYNFTGLQIFYNNYNKININCLDDFNKYKIVSIPIHNKDRVETIKKFIKKYENKSVYIVLMFHSIGDYKNNNKKELRWAWQNEKFTSLCAFLKEEQIKVLPIKDAVFYIERNF